MIARTLCWLLLLGVTSWTMMEAADVCSEHSDGCSIPLDLTFFYEKEFTPACYKHDVCYDCGELLGISRKACDEEFLRLMKQACKQLRRRRDIEKRLLISEEDICTGIAYTWYLTVRKGGASHFENPSKDYCTESWVSTCLPD